MCAEIPSVSRQHWSAEQSCSDGRGSKRLVQDQREDISLMDPWSGQRFGVSAPRKVSEASGRPAPRVSPGPCFGLVDATLLSDREERFSEEFFKRSFIFPSERDPSRSRR